mgnify:CR=1 FL=1
MDFEKKLNRLEEIVASMETGDLSLEEALKNFEEGIKLSRECHSQLNNAEDKVKVLLDVDNSGNVMTEDFSVE